MMEWADLISHLRIGDDLNERTVGRSPFQQDFDRIIFCSAFRRLQDKTQVFPLPESDYVRTRLTHSLEASCVGRSLGTAVGTLLQEKGKFSGSKVTPTDLGAIVSAACLAHDIGNPPFGHSGESAIQYWFTHGIGKTVLDNFPAGQERWDFLNFEGNAQGFRILTKLQKPSNNGGLQLTATTLAAFSKYPRGSFEIPDPKPETKTPNNKSNEKFGFFKSEKGLFEEVAGIVKLEPSTISQAWHRHPLAFLVEAADDICYLLLDFEDGYRLDIIKFDDIYNYFMKLLPEGNEKEGVKRDLGKISDKKEQVGFLRSAAINSLVRQVANFFASNENDILSGKYNEALIKSIPFREEIAAIKTESDRVYKIQYNLEVEAAGFEVIGGLLDAFVPAVINIRGTSPSFKSEKLSQLLSTSFWKSLKEDIGKLTGYERLLKITDYVSGMTDSFAVSLYRKIKGIDLPRLE